MLLDIALGIIIVEVLGVALQFDPFGWHYALGILFALLPDLDFLVLYFWKHDTAMYRGHTMDHRDLFHHPLLYIPVGTAVVFFTLGDISALLFAIASFAHFLHDSIGVGWGVRWLSPFSKRNYKFFSEKDGTPSSRLVTSWSPIERAAVVAEKGDPNWVWDFYVRPFVTGRLTIFAFLEVIVPLMVIALFLLVRPW